MSLLNCKSYNVLVVWDRPHRQLQYHVGGQEPYSSGHASQPYWAWYIGYISNRHELINKFQLSEEISDRDLLLHLYRQYGTVASELVAGPLTWIVWDREYSRLVAVRDRIGIYNIYYTLIGKKLWLANRVEVLLNSKAIPSTVNPRSVVAHLHGAAPVPGETFYDNVHAIEPGCLLEITDEALKVSRYWRVKTGPVLKLASDKEYADTLRELLFDVVAGHLPAKQAGITLSSGLDSNSVAAAIKGTHPGQELIAFSWITPELPEADESQYIKEVCNYLSLPVVHIRADYAWPLKTGQGFQASPSAPPIANYSELWDETFRTLKQHNTSILFTGLSGDHLFGSNVFAYPDLLLTGHWLELARQMRKHIPRSPYGKNLITFIRKTVIRPILGAYLPEWGRIRSRHIPWLGEKYRDLYYKELIPAPRESALVLPGRWQRLDLLCNPLLSHAVEWTTRQAADHSIELRHPLLDHRLFEFAAILPTSQTFRAGQRKIILRNAMRGYLPDSVLDMWGKIYPTAIFQRGVRERETEKVWGLMTDMRAAELGFVKQDILRQNYQGYLDDKHEDDRFWYAVTLEDWLRQYF